MVLPSYAVFGRKRATVAKEYSGWPRSARFRVISSAILRRNQGPAIVHQVENRFDFVRHGLSAALQNVNLRDGLALVRGVRAEARHGRKGVFRLAEICQVPRHLLRDLAP